MLHYDVRGDGEPVLLLHSGGMSSRQWRRLAEQLAPSYKVVSPDFCGSGENPPWPASPPFEFRTDVDAILEVMDTLGEPVNLVGHSYGGFVALVIAREHPEKVRSLALYDPVAFGVLYAESDAEGIADLNRAGENPVFLDDAHGGDEEWFTAFVDYWNGAGAWRALQPAMRESFLKMGRKVYGEVKSLMADRAPAEAYAKILAPTLFLTGDMTPIAAKHVCAILAKAMPQASIETIVGAGHMGPISHAKEVNARIEKHLKAASAK